MDERELAKESLRLLGEEGSHSWYVVDESDNPVVDKEMNLVEIAAYAGIDVEGLEQEELYHGIITVNGALDDVYKDLYNCRFYKEDMDGKSYVDKRRKLDNGLDNPNRDKRYWILEDRTDISKLA